MRKQMKCVEKILLGQKKYENAKKSLTKEFLNHRNFSKDSALFPL